MKYIAVTICLFLCLFRPVWLLGQEPKAKASILAVRFGNNQVGSIPTEIDLNKKAPVRLTFNQNYLHFSFWNPANPTSRRFYYRLVGLDYAWIRCDDCTQAHYAHLTGGDYTFQVKTDLGLEPPAEFKFFVDGDILHKWWFVPMLFLYLFVFLGIGIYFLILYNFRQKLREQRLIHTGKMASMAELTDGIAHEIQNPLNFVNNYAEVSQELVDELVEEHTKPPQERDDELLDELLVNLRENMVKINNNGQRANDIVRGMLQHSRRSSGYKDHADVNALVREFLQQAYDSQLSRDTSFKAEYKTEFDKSLPQIELVVLDIGQVLLNLMNNAFYAVNEKRTQHPQAYRPTVAVSTQRQNGAVEIRVTDNGNGIAKENTDKVFMPFFSTKPPGQGTGLGLSVSDTIVKAHGGELKMESVEGEGATFTLVLPL